MKIFIFNVLFLLVFASACAPTTKYLRTADISSPTGETLTLPMHDTIELSGSAAIVDSTQTLRHLIYLPGDPLVNPSLWQFAGLARFQVHPNIAIGAQGTVELAQSRNILSIPFDNEILWGLGPNIGFHFHPGSDNFTLGLSFALTMMSTPWATWERKNDSKTSMVFLPLDMSQYQRGQTGRDFLFLFRGSFGASYLFVEHVELFGGLSFQNTATNIGFDDFQRAGSTLQASIINLVPYLGIGVLYKPFFSRLQLYIPVQFHDPTQAFVGSQLQVGFVF